MVDLPWTELKGVDNAVSKAPAISWNLESKSEIEMKHFACILVFQLIIITLKR